MGDFNELRRSSWMSDESRGMSSILKVNKGDRNGLPQTCCQVHVLASSPKITSPGSETRRCTTNVAGDLCPAQRGRAESLAFKGGVAAKDAWGLRGTDRFGRATSGALWFARSAMAFNASTSCAPRPTSIASMSSTRSWRWFRTASSAPASTTPPKWPSSLFTWWCLRTTPRRRAPCPRTGGPSGD